MKKLSQPDFTGQSQTVDMMGLRNAPGEAVEFVRHGGTLNIQKNGKPVAVLSSSFYSDQFRWNM